MYCGFKVLWLNLKSLDQLKVEEEFTSEESFGCYASTPTRKSDKLEVHSYIVQPTTSVKFHSVFVL